MITLDNYFQKIATVDFASMPADLQKDLRDGDLFMRRVTGNGGDPSGAEASAQIRRTVDSYLALLNQVLKGSGPTTVPAPIEPDTPEALDDPAPAISTTEIGCSCSEPAPIVRTPMPEPLFLGAVPKKKGRNGKPPKKKRKPAARPGRKKKPFRFEKEFFESYVRLNGKRISKARISVLIDEIQNAIKSSKIKKGNPFGTDAMFMQNKLIALFNDMSARENRLIQVNSRVLRNYREIISWDGRIPGEILLEKFLALIGKSNSGTAIMNLCFAFETGLKNGRIQGQYKPPAKSVLTVLKKAAKNDTQKLKASKSLQAQVRETLGIKTASRRGKSPGSLAGPLASPLAEPKKRGPKLAAEADEWSTDQLPDNSHLQLGFEGKWKDLWGQPTKGFSAMVFGKPKMGKSTLVLEFAGYLVRGGFGSVLWVELEEDIFTTFKEKVDRLRVGHPDFKVRPAIPADLSRFDFIVINSVSEGKITPDHIREMKKKNPGTSFLLIYHTRKDGDFRGTQEHAHLVDVLVEVKEDGAFANGRFGRGETKVRFTA